jgi:hypothetical protein
MQTLSSNQQISTTNIPREQHVALFQLINKSRMLNGWTTKTAQELDATIRTWAEIFNNPKYQIPLECYPALYDRAFDARQSRLRNGDDPPMMDATLIVSCWTGPNGLKAEIEQRRIDEGRTLGANAASVCRHCLGSGWREVIVDEKPMGVKRCNHED